MGEISAFRQSSGILPCDTEALYIRYRGGGRLDVTVVIKCSRRQVVRTACLVGIDVLHELLDSVLLDF